MNIAVRLILELTRIVIFSIWALIGFIFWIPFLTRMIAVFTVSVLISALKPNKESLIGAEAGLNASVIFYIQGFQSIHSSINNIIFGEAENKGNIKASADITDNLSSFLYQSAYTIAFWVSFLWLLGVFVLPDLPDPSTLFSLPNEDVTTTPILDRVTN